MAKDTRRRASAQIARDRRQIADMYLAGWIQADIGDKLSLSQSTISRDIKALQEGWLESALVDFDAAKAEELAKVDRLEREYWAAWEASREDKKVQTTEKVESDKPRSKAQIRKEGQVGNPSFLGGVQWCIERRCKILGMDAAVKMDVSHKWSEDELDAAIATELARLAGRQAADVRATEEDAGSAEAES